MSWANQGLRGLVVSHLNVIKHIDKVWSSVFLVNCGASLVKIPTDKVLFGWIKYKYGFRVCHTNSRKPYNQALHAELATEDNVLQSFANSG